MGSSFSASSTSVVGLQWGDEAKGKIVDLLCDQHDVVVRYQGGANAGHTIVADGQTYVLSLAPTGVLRPHVKCVIGNGVVIHPASLIRELDGLAARGVSIDGRFFISDRAHVILPYHMEEERLTEETSSADPIGTTRRGIGPCYRDKVGRAHAIRIADLLDRDGFRAKLERILPFKNRLLKAMLPDFEPFSAEAIVEEYAAQAERLRPLVADTATWLHRAWSDGLRLMFEGAQGSLLDVDHGSFPYVTSSNSGTAGIASGSGLPTRAIGRWIGIVKAYTTRVGGGPFPTEQDNEIGERIRRVGREYGSVTGRPRRCGWFDAVAVRYSARVCGSNELAIMLLDVLSGIEELKVAVAYEDESGRKLDTPPANCDAWGRCRPVYETLPGWTEDVTGARTWDDLPPNAREYVRFLGDRVGVPVSMVSVGPDRLQTIRIAQA